MPSQGDDIEPLVGRLGGTPGKLFLLEGEQIVSPLQVWYAREGRKERGKSLLQLLPPPLPSSQTRGCRANPTLPEQQSETPKGRRGGGVERETCLKRGGSLELGRGGLGVDATLSSLEWLLSRIKTPSCLPASFPPLNLLKDLFLLSL